MFQDCLFSFISFVSFNFLMASAPGPGSEPCTEFERNTTSYYTKMRTTQDSSLVPKGYKEDYITYVYEQTLGCALEPSASLEDVLKPGVIKECCQKYMQDSMNPRKIYDFLTALKAAENETKDAAAKKDKVAGKTDTLGGQEATMDDLFRQIPNDCLTLEKGLGGCMMTTLRPDVEQYFLLRKPKNP
ncbi:hypothetical protein RF11_05298 [Thelohanellus kitauei]|uniref:Uncharacterized protein n=1 Tax=Thelohanellus kitauei TaxID=669202 RepID=A0A0C2MXU0_THEKT|nr:hypothetical protein RF11_05298 [Thelohanellus kitauei]